ncbi:MAG: mandelate racemase/muconate lactonizing enzyme family protein [Burkholderiales bacterium]
MKIASVAVHPLSATTAVPLSTAHETFRTSHFIIVEVKTDDGLTGYGKVHGEPMKAICEWILRFGDIIKGMDALGHGDVWEKLFLLTCPRPGGILGSGGLPPPLPRGARPQIMAAIAGIDIALWDIKGKAAGLPVYKLLGGARKSFFTYATGSYYRDNATLETYTGEMASFVERGYRAVKAKCCWAGMDEEVERIAAIRDAIGKDTLFMLDMNAPYDVDECIRFAHAVAPYNIHWLEEPLHWYLQPADYVRLAAASPIPLAHGERELTRFTMRDFIANGSLRFAQFDATRYAGFTEGLRVAQLAEQYGVQIAPHLSPEFHTHLCVAFPSASFAVETIGNKVRDVLGLGIYKNGPVVKDGEVHITDAPGFGIDVDWDFVNQYRAK